MKILSEDVRSFMTLVASSPFKFGEWDCGMVLANWIRMNLQIDPAASLRGSYSSEAEWKSIVDRNSGLIPLIASLVEPLGLQRVQDQQIGDIAVVFTNIIGEAGAIRVDRGWMLKVTDGVLVTQRLNALAIWRMV